MSEICANQQVNLVYSGNETTGEIVSSPMVGEKINTSGMLLDPYEGILEDTGVEVFYGIPFDTVGKEWMQ
jgi:hypothetical protein